MKVCFLTLKVGLSQDHNELRVKTQAEGYFCAVRASGWKLIYKWSLLDSNTKSENSVGHHVLHDALVNNDDGRL